MKINPISSNEMINQYKGKVGQKTVTEEVNGISDTLELSEGAKNYSTMINDLKGRLDSGVDAARIRDIADRVANGTYSVDSAQVAEKMLGSNFDAEA